MQAIRMVLDGLPSEHSRRAYGRALSDFFQWHRGVGRPRLSKAVNSTVLGVTTSAGASGVAPYASTCTANEPVASAPIANAVHSRLRVDCVRSSQMSNARQKPSENSDGTNARLASAITYPARRSHAGSKPPGAAA